MPEREEVIVQLFLASLYFVSAYIIGDVFWPTRAFQVALVGLILSLVGYLVLRSLGLHQPGPALGLYISFGVSLLAFGMLWLIVREIVRATGRWPLDHR